MPTPAPNVFLRSRRIVSVGLGILSLTIIIAASVVVYQRQQPIVQKINYSELYTLAETTGSTSLVVEGETMTVRKSDGTVVEATVTAPDAQHDVVELARKNGVPIEFRPIQPGLLITVLLPSSALSVGAFTPA
jgi:hypothetical protein